MVEQNGHIGQGLQVLDHVGQLRIVEMNRDRRVERLENGLLLVGQMHGGGAALGPFLPVLREFEVAVGRRGRSVNIS